ncbi:MAG: hypothetical protein U0457_08225 [Candidatus Sericytochromatia bacterium]
MFGKFVSKFVEPKVKADKFVDTFTRITSEHTEIKKEVVKEKQIDDAFSSLFSSPKANVPPPPPTEFLPMQYFKNTFEPFGKRIKDELAKHERMVKININPVINLGTIIVNYKGRDEYEYILQIRPGKTEQTSRVVVKDTGERGGHDERASLTGLTVDKISLSELLQDFLAGYKRNLARKGWK